MEKITNNFNPIFKDFLQSYLEKDVGTSDKDWLKNKLKQESLNLTDEALDQLSSELAGGVVSFNETLASIDNSRKQGQKAEVWLATKAEESTKNVTVDELQAVEGFLQGSNDRLLRSLKAAEQVKSIAKTSIEVVAEQILLDDFNRSSADSNARYEAAIDEASANSVYGRNFFDLVVKDKFTGKPLEHYQVMFGKTVQETIDMIAAADTAGQKFIVPKEMVEEVQKALPGRAVLDRLGGSKLINLASNPLSSKIIEKCLTGELPSVINQISSADSGTLIKSIANNAVASGVLSSGMLDGLEKVVGKKVINDFGGRELLEQALLSGNTEGIKVAASGALATCVNKGLVKALPANTPGIVVSGLASAGIENIKVLSQVASGKMTMPEALNRMGDMNLAMAYEFVWGKYAKKVAALALNYIPVVGPIVSTLVSAGTLPLVGEKVRSLVFQGLKKVVPVVKTVARKAYNTVKSVCSKVKNFVCNFLSW
ncbi:hypothetical protein [Phascolarctobacterium succinatutens]|uniref:hypothetical protein n=1 Tax=Phascolarctobacterium succinatutens TaxID=626940 RepID=UPI0026F2816A|nr:hypothetical protein [Phascolarctobacterium succinatutens]